MEIGKIIDGVLHKRGQDPILSTLEELGATAAWRDHGKGVQNFRRACTVDEISAIVLIEKARSAEWSKRESNVRSFPNFEDTR